MPIWYLFADVSFDDKLALTDEWSELLVVTTTFSCRMSFSASWIATIAKNHIVVGIGASCALLRASISLEQRRGTEHKLNKLKTVRAWRLAASVSTRNRNKNHGWVASARCGTLRGEWFTFGRAVRDPRAVTSSSTTRGAPEEARFVCAHHTLNEIDISRDDNYTQ